MANLKVRILPYKMGSRSCIALTLALRVRGLDTLRIYPEGNYRPRAGHLIVNWGSSNEATWDNLYAKIRRNHVPAILNLRMSVSTAANKYYTLRAFRTGGVSTPEYYVPDSDGELYDSAGNQVARQQCPMLVARTQLRGHSGLGIVMTNPADYGTLVAAPLYTQYIKKAKEFRVHVFKNRDGAYEVIDVQQKKQRTDFEGEVNYKIRNHANGWVFCRQDIVVTEELKQLAISAVRCIGLDFGAVDIIWNKRQNKYYALEVNTAPGLEGETVNKYADAIAAIARN